MALNWQLTLKDGVSGPAKQAGGALSELERRLKAVRKEAERQKKLEAATAGLKGGATSKMTGTSTSNLTKEAAAAKKAAAAYRQLAAEKAKVAKGHRQNLTDFGDMASAGLGQAGLAAMVGLPAAAGAGIFKLGTMIQDAQAFRANTMFALETILKSKSAAADAFAMATRTAMETGTDFRTSMSGFNTLLAQGFDVKFADQLVRAMADLQTINPAANMEGITRAISQIKSTGRLQGDELMQLAEAGLSIDAVYKEIAKSMGIVEKKNKKGQIESASEQVQDLQRDGKISSKVAIDAIMASLKNQVGGKAFGATAQARADATLTGMVMRAMTLKELFLSSVAIDWSPLSNVLSRVMDVMQSPAGEKFSRSLGRGFDKLLKTLDGISSADIEQFLSIAGDAFESTVDGAVRLADALGRIVGAYTQADAAFQSATGMSLFEFTLGSLIGTVENTIAILSMVPDQLLMLAEVAIGAVTPLGGAMVDGIVAGIEAGAAAIVDALVGAVESAVEAAESALGIASPSRRLRQTGRHTSRGFELGIADNVPRVERAALQMSSAPFEAGRKVATSMITNSSVSSSDNSRRTHIEHLHVQDSLSKLLADAEAA